MAKKFDEYNRGRMQGLEMAYRLLRDEGMDKAAALIGDEIRKRGQLPVQIPVTTKEIEHGLAPIKACLYETCLCNALMVLHDRFDFGRIRCERFLENWHLKEVCLFDGDVTWIEKVLAVKEEIGIDLPTRHMKEEGLIE